MQLAFIMPNEAQRQKIAEMHKSIAQMRPDQAAFLAHLIRSWRVTESWDALLLTTKAIKRTFRDRP